VEDVTEFLLSLVPFLNAGTLALVIDLGFERLGFKITRREFKKEPLKSLIWALCLVFVSSVVALITQTRLSGLEPLFVLIILFAVYLALTQA
jgi:peptidoglycan/LPS O-acetylase OafA/YrhL